MTVDQAAPATTVAVRVPALAGDIASADLIALVDRARGLAADLDRDDLTARLAGTRSRLLDPDIRVVVVGQFKQGKSKLVNALINAPVCAVDDDLATSVPIAVGFGPSPSAEVLLREDGARSGVVDRVPVPIDGIDDFLSSHVRSDDRRTVVGVEVSVPREILNGGLRIVDSPGVGGFESTRSLSTLTALSSAHAVLLVSDASQEYTEPEMQFLRHALRISPNVAAVVSKTDIYPQWRDIESIDRGHLSDVGDVPVFAVSSDLRLLAAGTQDRELNDESGFPALVAHLRRNVLGQAEEVQRRAASHDLVSVTEQLALSLQTELNALLHPEETPALIARLEEYKTRAEEFRSRGARWQVALSDGVADLISDTEHDLRDRLRKVQHEAETSIEEGDPGPIWDQIVEWIDQRVAAAVAETFVWTDERSKWLAEQVAREFAEDELVLPRIDVGATDGVLDPVTDLRTLDEGRLSATEKIYIGVRGSYGGVLMVGLATSLIGLPLINPLSLLAGVLVGRRAYREDMSSRLLRRQFEAKNLIRRHIEEVVFQVGKQLKDRLRLVQRASRDHFTAIADELHRSITESVTAARQAAVGYERDRDSRVQALRAQLARVEEIRRRLPAPVHPVTVHPGTVHPGTVHPAIEVGESPR
ncbi:MAG TPA: dynamin family protein [Agromyces sp.]